MIQDTMDLRKSNLRRTDKSRSKINEPFIEEGEADLFPDL